ncbi:MAG: RNase adapter RapZ [Oligoflexales bacterium]|nr:RNase adapter RapZ [Oligoflexales bacterium]
MQKTIYIVTGLAGAGRSTVLKSFEDREFYCLDNLNIDLLRYSLELIRQGKLRGKGYAFGLDVSDEKVVADFPAFKASVSADFKLRVIFLTAEPEVIIARFGATRRRHPLAKDTDKISELITQEKLLLQPIENLADMVLDTSQYEPRQLNGVIEQHLAGEIPTRSMHVVLTSFGFKNGLVTPVDLLFDVRFLRNPFYVEELKEKTGIELGVKEYISEDVNYEEFMEKICGLLTFLLPKYYAEGKHYLRIGVGCTGGKHRSVFVAEELLRRLTQYPQKNLKFSLFHRDITH